MYYMISHQQSKYDSTHLNDEKINRFYSSAEDKKICDSVRNVNILSYDNSYANGYKRANSIGGRRLSQIISLYNPDCKEKHYILSHIKPSLEDKYEFTVLYSSKIESGEFYNKYNSKTSTPKDLTRKQRAEYTGIITTFSVKSLCINTFQQIKEKYSNQRGGCKGNSYLIHLNKNEKLTY